MGGLPFVHYCVFCGAHHQADTATMLAPAGPRGGCPVRACRADEFGASQASLADRGEPRRARMDGAGPIAILTTLPWLLPLLGMDVRDLIFGVPLMFLV